MKEEREKKNNKLMNETEDKMKLVTVSRKHYMLSEYFSVWFCFVSVGSCLLLLFFFSSFLYSFFRWFFLNFIFYFLHQFCFSLARSVSDWMNVLECANKDSSRACKSHANSRNQSSKWFTWAIFILSIELLLLLQNIDIFTRRARCAFTFKYKTR